MPNEEAEETKLRVVQSQAHSQEKLDVEVPSCPAVAYRRLRGPRVEGSELVGEAVELLDDDAAAKGEVSRPLHENRACATAENFYDFPGHRRSYCDRASRCLSEYL